MTGRVGRRDVLKAGGIGGIVSLAGCVGGGDAGHVLLDENGEQVSLTIVYPTASDAVENTGRFIAEELEDNLGFAVEQDAVPFDAMLRQYAMQTDESGQPGTFNMGDRDVYTSENDWDLMFGIGFNSFPRTPGSVDAYWTADGGSNFYGYEPDGDIEELLAEGKTAGTDAERRERFAEAFGILSEELPVNFVQFDNVHDGFRREVVHTETPTTDGLGFGYKSQTWRFEDGYGGENTYVTEVRSEVQDTSIYRINDETSATVADAVLDGPYDVSTEDDVAGRWFESIESVDDRTWTCTLRDNLEWSEPYGRMTSADWEFFVENVATYTDGDGEQDNWAGYVDYGQWWVGDEPIEIDVQTDHTFDLHLPEPNPTFVFGPTLWETKILPMGLTEPYLDAYEDGEENAGSDLHDDEEVTGYEYTGNLGPYTFEERRIEDRIVLSRNDDYYMRAHGGEEWEEAPYFEEYRIRIIEEEATRLAELEAGGLTHAKLPVGEVERFEDAADVTVVEYASPYCRLMPMNQRANGWEELRTTEVRKAIAHAVDKSAIVEDIYLGLTEMAHTFQPRWSSYYDDAHVMEYGVGDAYDPERGRDLLKTHLSGGYGYE